jgi:hypothetical protein
MVVKQDFGSRAQCLEREHGLTLPGRPTRQERTYRDRRDREP